MARIFREATTIVPLTSMRYKDIIIFIGKPSGNSYPTLFESGEFLKKCKVRILSLIML